jgi:hypothetical protein
MSVELLNKSNQLCQRSDQLINKSWQLTERKKKQITQSKELIAKVLRCISLPETPSVRFK